MMNRLNLAKTTGKDEGGQSMIEAALLIPFLLILAFNAVNFGYFFAVALNLASAPRQGAQYSIMGSSSYANNSDIPLPGPIDSQTSVSYLVLRDVTNALPRAGSSLVVVCSPRVGVNDPGKTSQNSKCSSYGGTPAVAPSAPSDPEAPYYSLNQVEITYTVRPLIPAAIFNLPLTPTLNFHRKVLMRAM